ncbi:MAG TPA: RidA family protein [Phycisphaeraceae bacterium]
MDIHAKLRELNLELPKVPAAVAQYVPALRSGNQIYVSGQLCTREGHLIAQGPVPTAVSLEEAQAATRQCVLNALAAVDQAIEGDWSMFVRVVRLAVYVNSHADFNLQHKVANGGSELLGELFGEAGRHVRAAVGVSSLPLGATVEAELLVEVR